ncbi:MAG: hypothetical protein H0T58_05490 [Gemmatimonadales bacterium]|nr:hypothetical protein [Gemmatimonadales bacterium]
MIALQTGAGNSANASLRHSYSRTALSPHHEGWRCSIPGSSYGIGSDGTLTLIEAVAARTSAALGPRDQDLTGDGRYLYVIDVGTQQLSGYEVGSNGSLTSVAAVGGLPPTIAGLAAR